MTAFPCTPPDLARWLTANCDVCVREGRLCAGCTATVRVLTDEIRQRQAAA